MAGERTKLIVKKREHLGSRETRRLRRQGLVPGVLYGRERPVAISIGEHDLRVALTGDSGANAVMAFAEKVVDDSGSIGEDDHQRLRDLGLSEKDILDVVLAATLRCFFAKTLDALCTLPDASYAELPEDLRNVLVVGRPIAAD